jgi:hypothetical protein
MLDEEAHLISHSLLFSTHKHRGGRGNVFVLVRDDPVAAKK